MQRADKAARAYDPRIQEVRVSYADELRRILVIGSDGSFAEDVAADGAHERLLHCQVEATSSARGTSGGGGRVAIDYFLTEKTARALCQGSGAAGDHSARRARGAGGRDGSGARPGMAGHPAA